MHVADVGHIRAEKQAAREVFEAKATDTCAQPPVFLFQFSSHETPFAAVNHLSNQNDDILSFKEPNPFINGLESRPERLAGHRPFPAASKQEFVVLVSTTEEFVPNRAELQTLLQRTAMSKQSKVFYVAETERVECSLPPQIKRIASKKLPISFVYLRLKIYVLESPWRDTATARAK